MKTGGLMKYVIMGAVVLGALYAFFYLLPHPKTATS